MIINVAFLCFAGPWLLADHIEVGISGLLEFLIFFEGVPFEAISAPGKEFEHVGVFLSVFGGFSEDMLGEVYAAGSFSGRLLAGWDLHLEILYDFSIISIHYLECFLPERNILSGHFPQTS